jgi:hypothetical protein
VLFAVPSPQTLFQDFSHFHPDIGHSIRRGAERCSEARALPLNWTLDVPPSLRYGATSERLPHRSFRRRRVGRLLHMPFHINAADHTGITVSNLERSLAFWRDVLGFELSHRAHQTGDLAAEITGVPGAEISIAVLKGHGHKVELLEYLAPPSGSRVKAECSLSRPKHSIDL